MRVLINTVIANLVPPKIAGA